MSAPINQLAVKIVCDASIRRFTIPFQASQPAAAFDALKKVIAENYAGVDANTQPTLKFQDEEEDLCLLTSTSEFVEAVRLLGNPPATLKLFLSNTKPVEAPKPETATVSTLAAAPAPAVTAAAPAPTKVDKPAVSDSENGLARLGVPVSPVPTPVASAPAPKASPAPAPAPTAPIAALATAAPVYPVLPKVSPNVTVKSVSVTSTPKPTAASPKKVDATTSASPKKEDAKAEQPKQANTEAKCGRHKCREFFLAGRVALADPAFRAAIVAVAPAAVKAIQDVVAGTDKRPLAEIAAVLINSNDALKSNDFLKVHVLPKLAEIGAKAEPFRQSPFLASVVPLLPLLVARLPVILEHAAKASAEGARVPDELRHLVRAAFHGAPFAGAGAGPFAGFGAGHPFFAHLFGAGPHGFSGQHPHPHHHGHGHGRCQRGAAAPAADQKAGTTADGKVVHVRISCDGCGASPIVGVRYKCQTCPNYDLCEKCEATGKHPATHSLLKIRVSEFGPRPAATAAGPVVHRGIHCDGCQAYPIVGVRYKCRTCEDYDLCEKCEAAGDKHPAEHVLIKMKTAATRDVPRGPCGRRGWGGGAMPCHRFGGSRRAHCAAGNASRADAGQTADANADMARALAASMSDLIGANPFLSNVVEAVEVRNAAPDATDPNTASIPLAGAGFDPSGLLAALLPAVFQKVNAAKAAAEQPKADAKSTADAKAASPTAAAAAASTSPASDVKAEPAPAPSPAAVVAPAVSAEVAELKNMGFGVYGDDILQQLVNVGESKKNARNTAVQWVVEQIVTGEAENYIQ